MAIQKINNETVDLREKDKYVYFLYSESQYKTRVEIEGKLSRTFIPGEVLVKGRRVKFTEMSLKDTNIFTDCKLITEGLQSKMIYTDPKVVNFNANGRAPR